MNKFSRSFEPAFDLDTTGGEMHELAKELYPICRSITGDGFRETLTILRRQIPIEVYEVPSGTAVFDWSVPKEWNIRDAYVLGPNGEKVIDFQKHNLHVLNYSVPVNATMPLEELKAHLYTLPDKPDWIPYKTSYYKESWGFCLSHNDYQKLEDGDYQVVINSTLEDGSLTYGELCIPGQTTDEVLISCHACHPSLCNDNLSGLALCAFLAKQLMGQELRYTYRFLFVPGTIGPITWLALHEEQVQNIRLGLVVACVGDPGHMHYKKTRNGNAEIDLAVAHVLRNSGEAHEILDFSPYGYDERQYCSPGFNLNVGSLTRTPHGQFPEYHTSADNLDFIRGESLANSLEKYLQVVQILEGNRRYVNTNPKCEPQLGKRGLYSTTGGYKNSQERELAILWTLNLSDGEHSLLDIADRAQMPFLLIREAADRLEQAGLLLPQ